MNSFPDPSLLLHSSLPRPLHTVNPRSLNGQYWWDKIRVKAYATYGFKCWACGIEKHKAKYYQRLEAHECYDIDWADGLVQLENIVALCHSCHSFIHSGRLLNLHYKGKLGRARVEDILRHGFGVLKQAGLKPGVSQMAAWYVFKGMTEETALLTAQLRAGILEEPVIAEWSRWRLLLNGTEHFSPFKDEAAWAEFMSKKDW